MDVDVTSLSYGCTSMMIYLRCTFAIQTIIFTEKMYSCKMINLHDEIFTLKKMVGVCMLHRSSSQIGTFFIDLEMHYDMA